MKHKILFRNLYGAVLAGVLICATTLPANATSDHKRSGGGVTVDIENFGKVNDHFYRGAQPKGRNYDQLAALGVKTIVDLRDDAERGARSDAEGAKMRYINLPMKEKSYPTADTAAHFLEIVNNQANWPVFVHCAGGRHRTGVMAAVYRMSVDGWDLDKTYQEMKQFEFSTSWGHSCYKDYVYDYYRDLQANTSQKQHTKLAGSGK